MTSFSVRLLLVPGKTPPPTEVKDGREGGREGGKVRMGKRGREGGRGVGWEGGRHAPSVQRGW